MQAIAYMSADGLQQIAGTALNNIPTQEQIQNGTPFLTTQILIKTHDQTFSGVSITSTTLTQLLKADHVVIFDSHFLSTTGQHDTLLAINGMLNIVLALAIIALLLVCV